MQFLANLSQNQRIGLIAGVLVVLFLIIFFTTRKQSYEEMKKEEMEAVKEYVENQPENIKMKQYNLPLATADYLPAKLIDGSPLYTEIQLEEADKFNIVYASKKLNIPVERVFYDDVDFWFVGSNNGISYVIVISPDDVSPLQYMYKGTPDQLPNLDPSQLEGFKELNQLALMNPKNPHQNVLIDIKQELREKASLLPNLGEHNYDEISKIGINANTIIVPLYTNEVAFRRAIRNARLKLREMERKNNSLTYQDKINLINNTILEFMLQEDVIRNFDMASQELSKFQFDNVNKFMQNNGGKFDCSTQKSYDKGMIYALDKILGTYKNMLNRLFSAVMTNSDQYAKICGRNPELLKSYQNIVNSLRFIVSNKEFLSQVCPACPACPMPQRGIEARRVGIVQKKSGTPLNIASLEVLDENGKLIKPNNIILQPKELRGYPGNNLLDGNTKTFAHTTNATTNQPAIIGYEFDTPVRVFGVRVVNRQDCCQDRILGSTLILESGYGKDEKITELGFKDVSPVYDFKF